MTPWAATFIFLAALCCSPLRAADAPVLPVSPPPGLDGQTWQRMIAIDAKVARIADLTADFEQQKFTPLLKKPMVSSGLVRAKGDAMFWDTRTPEPTLMRVDGKEVSIYYPQQKTVEIYPIGGQLSAVAASPLPRLATLLGLFSFAPASAKDFGLGDDTAHLALRLTPVDESLRTHVSAVIVLIDTDRGFISTFTMVDADGERTVIRFSNVKTNTNLDDSRLRLSLPPDVKTVRPLENAGEPPAGGGPKPK